MHIIQSKEITWQSFFLKQKNDHSRHCNARLRIVYSYWDLRHQCREIGTRLIATADLSSLSVTQFTRGPLFGWWSTLKCDDPISMIVDSSTRLTKSSKGGMWYTDLLMIHYSLSIAHWRIITVLYAYLYVLYKNFNFLSKNCIHVLQLYREISR